MASIFLEGFNHKHKGETGRFEVLLKDKEMA